MRSGFKGRPEGMAGKWATANVANLSRMDATDQSQRAEACMGGGEADNCKVELSVHVEANCCHLRPTLQSSR